VLADAGGAMAKMVIEETEWNAALRRVGEVEGRLRQIEAFNNGAAKVPDKELLFSLAQDLPEAGRVWLSFWTNLPKSDRTSCRSVAKRGRCDGQDGD